MVRGRITPLSCPTCVSAVIAAFLASSICCLPARADAPADSTSAVVSDVANETAEGATAKETAAAGSDDIAGEKQSKQSDTSLTARSEFAWRLREPRHLSKARQYLYLRGSDDLTRVGGVKRHAYYRYAVRGHYDAVFDLTNKYPRNVERDEESDVDIREAIVGFTLGKADIRVGSQQVVWGEAVGLFFADVVNPKDYREFLLRDLDDIRIPLLGIDTTYSLGSDRSLELFWTPQVRFSKLPVEGAEFQFFRTTAPPGVVVNLKTDPKPAQNFENSTMGLRYSWLRRGTDASLFYLHSWDDLPALSKSLSFPGGVPTADATLSYQRVNRFGATLTRPLGNAILKSEVVYTKGRRFEARAVAPAVERDYISGMVGANLPFAGYNLDLQLFQSQIFGGGEPTREKAGRTGVSIRLGKDASLKKLKPELLFVGSINQKDVWISPKLHYRVNEDTTVTLGVDYLNGRRDTLFGQFSNSKRAQLKLTRRIL